MFIPLVITPQKYKAFSNMYLFAKERIRNRPNYTFCIRKERAEKIFDYFVMCPDERLAS